MDGGSLSTKEQKIVKEDDDDGKRIKEMLVYF